MPKAISHQHAGQYGGKPFAQVTLAHDERHLRRKLLSLDNGDQLLIDLPKAVALGHGDVLVLDDDRLVEIIAAKEPLYVIEANDPQHLSALCWHIGNRHLPAQIEAARILIVRDRVIKEMLVGLGAKVSEIDEAFFPERGAYHNHDGHSHDGEHHNHHG